MANLRLNPSVEVNIVDPFVRKGYRFKGVATILESGPPHQQGIAFYQARGSRVDLFKEIVLVRVQTTQPIDSPAYDLGMTEDEVAIDGSVTSSRFADAAPPCRRASEWPSR
jgi:hypothetical protein